MSRRAVLWLCATAGFLCLVVPAAWRLWLVPLQMMHELGLRGPLLTTGRECRRVPSTSTVRCDASHDLSRRPRSFEHEVLIYDSRTNAIHLGEHSWVFADSMSWVRVQDSIREQMRARRIPSRNCAGLDSMRALMRELTERAPSMTKTTNVWAFPHQEVRLDAYHWIRDRGYTLTVVGLSDGTPECRQPTMVYRLPTWAEMMTEWHHWLADRLGF